MKNSSTLAGATLLVGFMNLAACAASEPQASAPEFRSDPAADDPMPNESPDGEAPPDEEVDQPDEPKASQPKRSETYTIAKQVCSVFSPKKIAKDLGISSTDPVDLAEAYAEDYRPGHFRQDAFDGCLDALR